METFEIVWWHWLLLGAVLLTADIVLINIYYLIWFGASAVLTGTALLIFPSLPAWAQIILFTLASVAFLFLWLRIWQPRKAKADLLAARKYLPGQAGVVVRFANGSGTLRLQRPVAGRDVWEFVSDAMVRPGDRLVIDSLNDEAMVVPLPATPVSSE